MMPIVSSKRLRLVTKEWLHNPNQRFKRVFQDLKFNDLLQRGGGIIYVVLTFSVGQY